MVKLTAAKTVDNSNLSELGLLSNWSALTGPSTVADRSSIAVSSGSVDMTVSGSGLTLVAREPVAGTVKGIVVEVNGHGTYALSNLSLYFLTIQDTFKGNFESSLFSRNDQLTGSSGNDALYGYKGSDTLSGKQGDDQLTGASGDDNLSGGAGNDILKGGADDDDLDGGTGKDQLTGATGRNSFVFDSKLDGINNVDTITDWTKGTNTIELDNSIFAGIGAQGNLAQSKFIVGTATTAKQVILYDKAAGNLYYDSDGSGPAAKILFAHVNGSPTLTYHDFLVI